jgi:hypothetical protein
MTRRPTVMTRRLGGHQAVWRGRERAFSLPFRGAKPVIFHRERIAELLLLVASILLTLLVLEAILRLTPYRRELFMDVGDSTPRYYYKADSDAGYDIRETMPRALISLPVENVHYEIWSNELGCFDQPYRGEKDYVLLVGDSFTHMFAPFDDKWGTVLERLIGHRVLKCGVNGYGTKQELLKAKRVIAGARSSPRLIMVGYFWNDLYEDYASPGETIVDGYLVRIHFLTDPTTGARTRLTEEEIQRILERRRVYCTSDEPKSPRLQSARCWLARNSIVYSVARSALRRLLEVRTTPAYLEDADLEDAAFYPVSRYPWLAEAWARHLHNLRAFKDLAAEHKAELLVVLLPSKAQVYPFLSERNTGDLEGPNRKLAAFLSAEQIGYLDLLPMLRQYADLIPRPHLDSNRDFFWRIDGHLSVPGNHLVGLLVARRILQQSGLDLPEKDSHIAAIEAKLKEFEPKPH